MSGLGRVFGLVESRICIVVDRAILRLRGRGGSNLRMRAPSRCMSWGMVLLEVRGKLGMPERRRGRRERLSGSGGLAVRFECMGF